MEWMWKVEEEGPLGWLEELLLKLWLWRAERGNLAAVAWPTVSCIWGGKGEMEWSLLYLMFWYHHVYLDICRDVPLYLSDRVVSFYYNWTHGRSHTHDMQRRRGAARPVMLCPSCQTSSYCLRGFLLASCYYPCIHLKKRTFEKQAIASSFQNFHTICECIMKCYHKHFVQSSLETGSAGWYKIFINMLALAVPVWRSLYCPLVER